MAVVASIEPAATSRDLRARPPLSVSLLLIRAGRGLPFRTAAADPLRHPRPDPWWQLPRPSSGSAASRTLGRDPPSVLLALGGRPFEHRNRAVAPDLRMKEM